MTQAITEKLNNLEQMLMTAQNKSNQSISANVSGMDKNANFKQVLDDKLKNVSSEISEKKSNIADIKENSVKNSNKEVSSKEGNTISSEEFREIVQKATDEANVETSLDLTLARDINEIITQLKEAIENTANIIEASDEKEVEETVDEALTLDEELMADLPSSQLLDLEENQENGEEENKNLDFEQLLASANKMVFRQDVEAQKSEIISDSEESSTDILNNSQNEIIEFSENIVDEVINTIKPTKDMDEAESSIAQDVDLQLDENILKELKIESIQADSSSTNGDSLMQNQAPEEYAIKAMINQDAETFEVKVEPAQQLQNNQNVQTKTTDINPSRIIDQISKHLESLQNNSKVNIVLNPESLGKVNIQLLTTKEGLAAQFTVTTQEARDLLMKGLDGLKESLTAQGVGVDQVSVKLADSQKSEYKQDWTEQEGSRGGNKGQEQQNKEEKQKGLFEKMMANVLEDENGNV